MNRLKTDFTGLKVPFNWDDLAWMQSGIKQALEGFMKTFLINNDDGYPINGFKLSGADVTVVGNNYTTTQGWIVLHGEVCYVPGNSVIKQGGHGVYYEIAETVDSVGNKMAYDAANTPVNVSLYEQRTAILVSKSYSITGIEYSGRYFSEIISEIVGMKELNSVLSGLYKSYQPTVGTDHAATPTNYSCSYKLLQKMLFLNINIPFSIAATNPTYYDIKLPLTRSIQNSFDTVGFLMNAATGDGIICRVFKSPTDPQYIRVVPVSYSASYSSVQLTFQAVVNIN